MATLNLFCLLSKKATKTDLYGQAKIAAPIRERCSVVRLRKDNFHTSVRADASGTRGHGDEFRADVIILLAANSQAEQDDKLEVEGLAIRIKNVHPRFNVLGKLDHLEIKGELWG